MERRIIEDLSKLSSVPSEVLDKLFKEGIPLCIEQAL